MLRIYNLFYLSLLVSFNTMSQTGNLDYTFTTDFSTTRSVMTPSVVQKDGKIIVGGSFNINFIDGKVLSHLVRLNSDGSLDLTFKIGKGVNGQVTYLKEFSDGRILVAGRFTQFNGQACKSAFVIFEDGSLDTSFHTTYGNQEIYDVALLANNKIIVYGKDGIDIKNAALVRLNSNGTVDSTFEKVKVYVKDAPIDIVPLPNGNVLFSAMDNQYKSHIYLIKPDGSIDNSYNFENAILMTYFGLTAYKPLKDGKILLAGSFYTKSDSKTKSLLCVLEDGTIDQTFKLDVLSKYNTNNISCLFEQEDGKIIIGGFFAGSSAETSTALIRLHKNGNIDTTFNADNGFDAFVNQIVKYGDKKAIVTGSFQNYRTFFTSNVARIFLEDTIASPKPKNTWNFSFSITSNPNIGSFMIVANKVVKLVEVMDLTGKLVLTQTCNSQYPEVDMTGYADGMYIIKVFSEFEQTTQKMLKM